MFEKDFHLHYEEKGSGDVLILLHGNGEDLSYFVEQMDVFAERFHVYAVDTRGHGQSPRGEGEFSIRRFADDLASFMEKQNIRKASILGFSDGANIAMCFAIAYPEKVDKLILNGGNRNGWGVKFLVQAYIVFEYVLLSLIKKWQPQVVHEYELLRLMVKDPNLKDKDLTRILAKTLVIAGDRDMIKEKETRHIASVIPNSTLSILKGSHYVAKENPTDFNRVVLDFLNGKVTE